MVTHKFSETNGSNESPVVTAVPPARRNTLLFGIGGLLLVGMFSVAAASNHPSSSHDPVASAQKSATEMILDSGDGETLDALTQLRDSDPKNGIYSYLIAAQHARHQEWQPALAALRAGNEAPKLILAKSANAQGSYPALSVLRQLVGDCAAEASRSDSPENSDDILQESALLAKRLAQETTPCDLGVLQTAGSIWRTTEQARIIAWEKQDRYVDAETARARLADRTRWWQAVNNRIEQVDGSDPAVRTVAATGLRAQLPR